MVEEERRLTRPAMPSIRPVLGVVAGAAQGAFGVAVAAPLALAMLGLIWSPPFLTDETYWQASALGACGGAFLGLSRAWMLRRQVPMNRPLGKLVGGLIGLGLVLLIGVPCSGIGGAAAGILFWGMRGRSSDG